MSTALAPELIDRLNADEAARVAHEAEAVAAEKATTKITADRAANIKRLYAKTCTEILTLHAALIEAEAGYTKTKNAYADAIIRLNTLTAEAQEKRSTDRDGNDFGQIHAAVEIPPRPTCMWEHDHERAQIRREFIAATNRQEL